ncbi:zinc-binding dehydrogenase [Pimelobacter simplex]|uniref:2,3-butanediol dehydrogenase, R-alcohol forming, (R)-and (S)-acetoin-specific n=1 Tax=Nocardioides simplex TaxID=2045 RepID=A0A0A1DPC7_NOCSI|nr:zinc-binding dehydrogenase [Pimelobacter simplex]AIY19214.1 2,3-butanediol dehydrogenase, R-alcohol forming, (R)- and (S)-acetoin-specific [Pimelobacter simplex]KAB2812621.1 zinc-binding dehydrogenase [Pimelobacter simplex]MCG8149278.1 zinc-binding dehydrogenase [Pimelobacter simplex]GEB16592.1 dehydrogenase [Pimelobacter simplex]
MRAVVCHQAQLTVEELPDLTPAEGQILLDVERCGICGSDLHARTHCDETAADAAALGYDAFMRSTDRVVLGHEFVGTVADYGPRTRKPFPVGTRVVALPVLRTGADVHLTGLSEQAPGGYAEQVLVNASMTMRVPDSLDADAAALTEPMAVALHAVRRGEVGAKDTAVVIGCGPIGLAVIAMLKATGVRHVIASDFSPGRRALAERMGADVVVDPATVSPWASFADSRYLTEAIALAELGLDAMDKLRAVPLLPWAHVMRAAEKVGATPRGPVVFECVGLPGMIEHIISSAPLLSRVVVVGVCMGEDSFRPSMAINKEIDLRFAFAYDPSEFHQTLQWIGSGKVDVAPLVTGVVGLDGVAGAFADLGDPERHAKILVDPAQRPSSAR